MICTQTLCRNMVEEGEARSLQQGLHPAPSLPDFHVDGTPDHLHFS